ncbi:lysosomal acid phosphatase-like [Branchiostoma floridae x Branchiostoma belcheri]
MVITLRVARAKMVDCGPTSRVVYLLSVIFSLCLQIWGKKTLKFVSLVYRHGDRSPNNVYGNDTNTEDTWPQGFMQLSQINHILTGSVLTVSRRLFGGRKLPHTSCK